MKDLLPRFDFSSAHEITIQARPERVFQCLLDVDVNRSGIIRGLFALRGLPRPRPGLLSISGIGFQTLVHEPPTMVALGLIGQFWKLAGNVQSFAPEEFSNFGAPGYAKCVAVFEVSHDPTAEMSTLRTETRVQCLDPVSRRRFGRYWTLIGPFSGLIRTQLLKVVKQNAESSGSPGRKAA